MGVPEEMKRDQTAPTAFAGRRRPQPTADSKANTTYNKDKDGDTLFTTKYIDTLNDLRRLEEENKRLMLRVRSLEVK